MFYCYDIMPCTTVDLDPGFEGRSVHGQLSPLCLGYEQTELPDQESMEGQSVSSQQVAEGEHM